MFYRIADRTFINSDEISSISKYPNNLTSGDLFELRMKNGNDRYVIHSKTVTKILEMDDDYVDLLSE